VAFYQEWFEMKRFLISLLAILALPAHAQSEPVAGKDYIEIPNGRPLDAGPEGTVVVEEFFNYICPACNAFEPTFVTWTKQLPPYAKVHHVAASFRADFLPYARAYYAAEALGVAEKSHAAVYSAIHTSHSLPAEGDKPDEEKIAKFYARYGVDAQTFLATMRSFGVDSKVRRANEYMKRVRVTGTPAIVINGRYLVQGGSLKDTLRIASYLVEKSNGGGGRAN
jgi:protein dithiol oxidoreductase (disulfide-forming)